MRTRALASFGNVGFTIEWMRGCWIELVNVLSLLSRSWRVVVAVVIVVHTNIVSYKTRRP